MQRYISPRLAPLFAFVLASCATTQATNQAAPAPSPAKPVPAKTAISVTVKRYDGQPAISGHIRIAGGEVSQPAADGTASFEVESGRLYHVTCSAPGHRSEDVALLAAGKPIAVDVTLGTLTRLEKPESVSLVVYEKRGENYSRVSTLEMKRAKDGTYSRKIKSNGELLYRVQGLSDFDSVIDPGGTLRYDGQGGYLGVATIASDSPKITFNPQSLLAPGSEPALSIEGDPIARAIGMLYADLMMYREALQRSQKRRKEGERLSEEAATVAGWRKRIQERLQQKSPPVLRQALLVSYFSISPWWSSERGASKELNTERWRAEAFETVPLDSPLWAINPLAVRDVAEHATQAHLARFVDSAQDKELAAQVAMRELQEATWRKKPEVQRKYFTLLSEGLNNTEAGREFQREKIKYDPDAQLKEGQPVPSFDVPALKDARRITPASYAGKFYLIELWGTWCSPCVADMPELHAMYEKLSPKGLKMLSIALHDTPKKVRDFRKKQHPMPWDHAVVEGDDADVLLGMFSSIGVPAYILVDPKGNVAALGIDFRGEALTKMIEGHLSRPR